MNKKIQLKTTHPMAQRALKNSCVLSTTVFNVRYIDLQKYIVVQTMYVTRWNNLHQIGLHVNFTTRVSLDTLLVSVSSGE